MMTGAPPFGPGALVTLENWQRPPYNRWPFQHVRELIPTARIARGLYVNPNGSGYYQRNRPALITWSPVGLRPEREFLAPGWRRALGCAVDRRQRRGVTYGW